MMYVAEMGIRFFSYDTAAGRTVDKADLQQVWFIHILQRHAFFADRAGNRFQTDRPPLKALYDALQIFVIDTVQTKMIDL